VRLRLLNVLAHAQAPAMEAVKAVSQPVTEAAMEVVAEAVAIFVQ